MNPLESRSLKPFAVARLAKLSPRGRRIAAKMMPCGGRSDPTGINNREGATHYFFGFRAVEVVAALKGEAQGLVWEITNGQHERLLPSTEKQWRARISL